MAIVPPNEVHKMLEWGVNNLFKERIVRFNQSVSFDEMIRHLKDGGGVVLSGNFKLKTCSLNHIVSLAGFITGDDWDVTDFYY